MVSTAWGTQLSEAFLIQPIGFFESEFKDKAKAPSQGTFARRKRWGKIHLADKCNFEQALEDIKGMTHIWVLSWMHKAEGWKPKVLTPRGGIKKRGVFATRSPYRPNPLALSLVRLHKVQGREIWISDFDLLDGTPIIDLKPFHPQADVPQGKVTFGWIEKLEKSRYKISFSRKAQKIIHWLDQHSTSLQLYDTLIRQLSFDPTDSSKKRVRKVRGLKGAYALSVGTWRVHFSVQKSKTFRKILVRNVESGYSESELHSKTDKWGDLELHRKFQTQGFGQIRRRESKTQASRRKLPTPKIRK